MTTDSIWITAISGHKRLIEKEPTKFKLEHKQRYKLLAELTFRIHTDSRHSLLFNNNLT